MARPPIPGHPGAFAQVNEECPCLWCEELRAMLEAGEQPNEHA